MPRGSVRKGLLPNPTFRVRVFAALVGIAAAVSLVIGLVLYYFAEGRLTEAESALLAQRSQTANAEAGEFLMRLRDREDQSLPAPETYAEELVSSVADPTGLGVIFAAPDGEPLAARDGFGNSVDPEAAYERLGVSDEIVRQAMTSSGGRLVPRQGWPPYIIVWPLSGADGAFPGVMIYNSPQDALKETLAYLRYGIVGAIGASILLAGAASLLLARQVTRPLSETKDAAMRFASGNYVPMPVGREDELGEVARALNYMAEEIHRYVEEIQEQKNRLEAVLEASPEAVIAVDPGDRVTMANPAADRMLGVGTSVFGETLERSGIPEEVLECVREAAENGVAVRELEQQEKTYWAYAARMPKSKEEGEYTGVILAVRDITEHRALEKARTAFVSDVSHELRTPLTTIQSAVDLLEGSREELAPPQHRALELAGQELKRIRGMVEELLTLAQMDALQYALDAGPADLSKVIGDCIESLSVRAERFEISLHLDGEGEHHWCICDAGKLHHVFLNLLDNAIKYSNPGGRVDISIEEDDSSVTVRVRDTGVGIPEQEQAHLFERFYRVDKVRSRVTGGTGLGLAIVKEIVGLHGGEVRVDSAPGAGSTFIVRLPKATAPHSAGHAT